jgi:3'-5' exoribonuclease
LAIFTIPTLKQAAHQGRLEATVRGQVDSLTRKDARNGKPFWELVVADSEAKMTLRAWSDEPAFARCEELQPAAFIEISGAFSHTPNFGLDAKGWNCRELTLEERDALLAGPPELRARQEADFRFIEAQAASVGDPRLKALCLLFLAEHGERLRRSAAARQNHHARRGGLVEHVGQMLRTALALAAVYPGLNRDLLIAGVLFHDSGKLWENSMPADGFVMPFDERGEMLGHITIGIELVNSLWRKLLAGSEAKSWSGLRPVNDDVRLHLLHLVAAHHGELQFGSPIVPKTPEAWALHYVDNLDAKLEMMAAAYQGKTLAPRIFERLWPLPANSVQPLEKFGESAETAGEG